MPLRNRHLVVIALASAVAALAIVVASLDAQTKAPPEKSGPSAVGPSANKGRTGTYEVKTGHPGYNYFVYVPKGYSDDNPAGIHLYFHGQGGQGGAPWFGTWAKHFLEPCNLIGINMQYMDGDNMRDTSGKVAAAIEAIQQVIADYKVIRGRGVICSFSGGGLPHGMIYRNYGKRGATRTSWPFNHSALYDANVREPAGGGIPMSWFIGLGEKEWSLAALGSTQTGRAADLFADASGGACPDVYLKITKGKGHSMTDEDVADSAKQFRRSDLAFCPFIYAANFPEGDLQSAVRAAGRLALGEAASSVKQVLANPKLSEDVRKKATLLKEKIDARVEAVIACAKDMAENDGVMCRWYGDVFLGQLRDHPRLKELQAILDAAKKKDTYRAANAEFPAFASNFRALWQGGGPTLNPDAVAFLKRCRDKAGENSLLGKMSAEFLAIQ